MKKQIIISVLVIAVFVSGYFAFRSIRNTQKLTQEINNQTIINQTLLSVFLDIMPPENKKIIIDEVNKRLKEGK